MKSHKFEIRDSKFEVKDKKVVVMGLARSGIGAANLLSLFGAEVWATDIKSEDCLKDNIRKLLPSIRIKTGDHIEEIFNAADLIVVSPGVPLNTPLLLHAKADGIPIIGELELAYQIVTSYLPCRQAGELRVTSKKQNIKTSPEPKKQRTERANNFTHATRNTQLAIPHFIGVTGTNGKSTTTTLVDLMLKKSGFNTLLGGNIGNALTEEIYKALGVRSKSIKDTSPHASRFTPVDYVVTEVSSFQLESIQHFRPFISVILNITPDHLNRYSNMQEYIDAKARLFENQRYGDYLILNADDPVIMELYNSKFQIPNSKLKGVNILFFSRKREVEGIYIEDGRLYCKFLSTSEAAPPAFLLASATHVARGGSRRKQEGGAASPPYNIIAVDGIKIKGVHNLENVMAASLVAFICKCPIESIRSVLKDFSGLEHRLELVGEIDGVSFINDSKGTNIGAVVKSLESLQNIVLIMGGRDKDGDFTVLRDLIKKKVKATILLGEAKEKIAAAIGEITETILVKDIKEAVEVSMSKASTGDVVLLSPGCASFDMFADFEERGRRFKEAVNAIKNSRISS